MNTKRIIPLVDLKIQYESIKREINKAIKSVLEETNFISGQQIPEFEKAFSEFTGVKHCIAVSSGTDAIHLALRAAGISKGDEVILPSHTFTATAEPVVWLDAKPVFADIDKNTYLIDPNKIEKMITKKTKAIIPVHLYGQSVNLAPIMEIAKKYHLSVIEDCAQAHGADFQGKHVGSFGLAGIFSFYPGKNLGAYGDAGMIVTNNEEIGKTIRMSHDHGRTDKYIHKEIGFGCRMDTLQAAVLLVKLKHLKDWNDKRRTIAKMYDKNFKNIGDIKTLALTPWGKPVYHLYVIRTKKRDKLKRHLLGKGIKTGIHYPLPLHLQPAYKYLGYKKGDLPVTEKAADEILSLPLYPELTNRQINYICQCIKEFYY